MQSSKEEDENKKNQASRRPNKKTKRIKPTDDFFGPQYTSTADLPDPEISLKLLATGVVEVIAGTRSIDQLSRILSDEVYQRLGHRAAEAREMRKETGQKTRHQNFSVRNMRNYSPRDGVIESVVLINVKDRVRAVTIRLEGINKRWRATAVSVL